MQKYCIVRRKDKIVSFLLDENGHALEIHADPPDGGALLGNIYIARVQNVVKSIQAAFVEIAPGQRCYLPLEDLKNPIYTKKGPSKQLQQGDELVVQVSREGIKTKGPAVTSRLCFQGKYVILDMGKSGVGVSRKLDEESRAGLKQKMAGYWKSRAECETAGIVLRTNAAEASEEDIREELEELQGRMRTIRERAVYRTCYSCLLRMPAQWLRRLDGLHTRELKRIVIEEKLLFEQAQQYLTEERPELLPVLTRYEDPLLAMDKLYSLDRELQGALTERVWLKSGAYLVIQPTEALTVVDVNSGKNETGKKKGEALLKVNLEAARETARQIRLRNLSGIILVDFINMETEAAKTSVMEELREQLLSDPVQAHVVDMTKLNLVELTRKKVEKPLAEQIF